MKAYSGLPAGTYAFTETQVPGWTLSSISCTPSSGTSTNLTAGSATIVLAAGDNIVCTFVNTKPTTGSITIVKDAQPNDAQDFAFTPSQATMPQFLLDDDSDSTLSNMKAYSGLPAGTYAFTETQVLAGRCPASAAHHLRAPAPTSRQPRPPSSLPPATTSSAPSSTPSPRLAVSPSSKTPSPTMVRTSPSRPARPPCRSSCSMTTATARCRT
ncbi:MAG: hypothetical protein IPG23_23310 [Burkholderiales bacterium]|nr:hypothetical protein [Burkholderiales bacterium]